MANAKQAAKIATLKAARPDVTFVETVVGKNVELTAEGWPTLRFGNGGGVLLVEVRTYPNADAAMLIGDQLLAKQAARDEKKAAKAEKEEVVVDPFADVPELPAVIEGDVVELN